MLFISISYCLIFSCFIILKVVANSIQNEPTPVPMQEDYLQENIPVNIPEENISARVMTNQEIEALLLKNERLLLENEKLLKMNELKLIKCFTLALKITLPLLILIARN